MQKLILFFAVILFYTIVPAQNIPGNFKNKTLNKPKLVIGIVVDQMRWDFLYRYSDRYSNRGGFKRLLNEGFSCENTLIPYTPTVTACGHASIYTGSVPAIHGITGNAWRNSQTNQTIYCTGDDSVNTVGNSTKNGKMSPRNLLGTTICDELRLATNFKSKVIGIALKDRGAILPAGHSANGAYWYDNQTGDWITSDYYMNALPKWVQDFNAKKLVDKYYKEGWNTLYPLNTYVQSTTDQNSYENKPLGPGFPYDLNRFAGKNYGIIPVIPQGNTFTFEMAKAALTAEQLGLDSITDFLAVSLSSPDYIGHSFGPNSVEAEDDFLRLDKDLGDFLNYLNEKVGEGQYLIFLSADHGAAHIPAFLKENKIPAGNFSTETIMNDLNKSLKEKFRVDGLVSDISNYQVYLNNAIINSSRLNKKEINKWVIDYLSKQPGVARTVELDALMETTLNAQIKEMIANGYYPPRCGDLQIIFLPQWIEDFANGGTTHGVWNPYDAHIPLLWFGWNIKPGKLYRQVSITDIAPTLAAMLQIQMPSGNIGQVIEEVVKDN